MSRLLDSINRDGFDGLGGIKNTLNISNGGFNGMLPKIGAVDTDGQLKDAWINSHAYIREDIIPVVLKTPKAFDFLPSKELWKSTWISIITEHMHTINGFNFTVSVSTEEENIGKSDEMQETPTGVKIARTVITGEAKEKANKTISKFLALVAFYTIKEQYADRPLVSQYLSIDDIGGGYTPDYWSGAVLWIEPDITKKMVVDAWYSVQVYFKTSGERTGSKNKTSAGAGVSLSLDLAAITFNTQKVIELAEKLLPTVVGIDLITDNDLLLADSGVAPDAVL